MKIMKNQSPVPQDRLLVLLGCAVQGMQPANLEVHIEYGPNGLNGNGKRDDFAPFHWLAIINAHAGPYPRNAPLYSPENKKRWSNGMPVESIEDAIVWCGAYAFRAIWRCRRNKPLRGDDIDCERHACGRLNAWRVKTGRTPIIPKKLSSTFRKKRADLQEPDLSRFDLLCETVDAPLAVFNGPQVDGTDLSRFDEL